MRALPTQRVLEPPRLGDQYVCLSKHGGERRTVTAAGDGWVRLSGHARPLTMTLAELRVAWRKVER